MNREELIEEAAATIAVAELVSTRRTWGDLLEPQKDEYRRVASAVLAVFEKAQTPTDDEREVLAQVISDSVGGWNKDTAAITKTRDAILAAGFRRPAQTDPEYEYTSANYDGTPNNQGFYVYGSVPARIAKYRRVKAGDWEPVPNQSGGAS